METSLHESLQIADIEATFAGLAFGCKREAGEMERLSGKRVLRAVNLHIVERPNNLLAVNVYGQNHPIVGFDALDYLAIRAVFIGETHHQIFAVVVEQLNHGEGIFAYQINATMSLTLCAHLSDELANRLAERIA